MYTKPEIPLFIRVLCSTSRLNRSRYCADSTSCSESYLEPTLQSLSPSLDQDICHYLSQLSDSGSLNYHLRSSALHNQYPDDIDDTFSALYIVAKHNRDLITPPLLSRIICGLDSVRSSHNPILFNTWYSTSAEFISTDIVALTAVVAFFDQTYFPCTELKQYIFDSYLTKLNTFDLSISQFSEFYHSEFLPLYLFARITWTEKQYVSLFAQITTLIRNIKENHQATLTDLHLLVCAGSKLLIDYFDIVNQTKHSQVNHSNTAQSLGELLIDLFNKTSNSNSTYNNDPLYIERVNNGSVEYAYSQEFTQLLQTESSEATTKLQGIINRPIESHSPYSHPLYLLSDSLIECMALQMLERIISKLSLHQQTYIFKTTKELILSTDFRIVRDILYIRLQTHLNNTQQPSLIAINDFSEILATHLVGLLGHYLYDKIIDNDIDTSYASLSSFAMRIYKKRIAYSLDYSSFELSGEIDRILADIDIQLQIEINKLPYQISETARKSLGTAIVPITLFPDCQDMILRFFRSIQMIRQICDDFKDHEHDKVKNKYTTIDLFTNTSNKIDVARIETTISREFISVYNLLHESHTLNHSDTTEQSTTAANIAHTLFNYTKKLEQKINKLFFEIKVLDQLADSQKQRSK